MTHVMTQKPVVPGVGGVIAFAALVGAAAALLFAPKSGKETREDIRRKMLEAQEKGKTMGRKASEMRSKVADKAAEKTDELKDAASSKVDEMRGQAEDASTKASDVIIESRTLAEDAAAEVATRPRNRRSTTL